MQHIRGTEGRGREGGREGGRKGGKGQREEEIVKHNKVNVEHFGVSVNEIHVAMHRQHNAAALSSQSQHPFFPF